MTDWHGSKVLVIGAARQGVALARYIALQGGRVILNDQKSASDLESAIEVIQSLGEHADRIDLVVGSHPLLLLEGVDLVCVSGGVSLSLPLIVEAQQRGIPLSNDSQIFLEIVPCLTVGLTGSAGKTTTTTLVGRMAESWVQSGEWIGTPCPYRRVWVGGNIGSPLISVVDEIQPEDLAVIELSSFQLELMSLSPNVAAVLNVTPNHLDRHGTMEAYLRAKAHILGYQKSGEFTILGRDDPGAWSLKDKINGNLLTFGLSQPGADKPGTFVTETELVLRWKGDYPGLYSEGASLMDHRLFPREEVLLRGDHNLLNVLAACAVGAAIGIPSGAMREGVRDFKGVPHRLQYVRNIGGADWYNDSIATAPERAMAAIRSFSEPLILLAGGRDKDLPWEDFAVLVQKRVDHLVVFGECANKILDAMSSLPNEIGRSMPGPTITVASDLRKAVEAAAQMAEPGDVILLSPGGTSFDEFSDFEERGECFVQLVMAL